MSISREPFPGFTYFVQFVVQILSPGVAVCFEFKRFQTVIFNWPQNSFYLTLSSIKYSLDNYQLVFSVYSWSFLIIINQTFQGQFLMSNLSVFELIQWFKANLQSFSTENSSIDLKMPKTKNWPIWPINEKKM